MFVRKDKDGNLVGFGSIDHNRLAQLQEAEKRKAAKAAAESKVEAKDEPAKKQPVKEEAAPDEPKTAKSPATPAPTKLP